MISQRSTASVCGALDESLTNESPAIPSCSGYGTLGIAGGCDFSLEDGIFNPCLTEPTPKRLLDDGVVTASWQGIDPAKLWDCHAHIAGVGDGNTGYGSHHR